MFGWLPRDLKLRIPERHLGLVPGGEQVNSVALVADMGVAINARFNVGGIEEVARRAVRSDAEPREDGTSGDLRAPGDKVTDASAAHAGAGAVAHVGVGAVAHASASEAGTCISPAQSGEAGARATRGVSRRLTIAVARDEAFCFYYPENLELLAEEGAQIAFFSPLRGEHPPENAAAIYLGGGYPELHGPALASNTALWRALRDLHAADAPIYAECGGFMVLTEALVDSEGHSWPMAGLLPGVARMTGKLAALGYRHATALRANLLVESGDCLRGHEFRYSTWARDARAATDATAPDTGISDATAAWEVRGTRTDTPVEAVGYARGNLLASYLHVHFGQRREMARRFVQHLR